MAALAEKYFGHDDARGWSASLQFGLSFKDDKTVVGRRCHDGPLALQQAFYPESDGTCHVYVLHPPGGIVGGDSLDIEVTCDPGSSALITTPAANKFYRSNGLTATQDHAFTVQDGACLEWLPQETIVFDGARVQSSTRVHLAGRAGFLGWEIVSFGRPACGETFARGSFRQCFEIWQGAEPLLIDRIVLQDCAETLNAAWGLREQPVMGLMVVSSEDAGLLESARVQVRDMIDDVSHSSVTVMGSVLLCRSLDTSSMAIRDRFIEIWKAIRPVTLGKEPCEPRIWAT